MTKDEAIQQAVEAFDRLLDNIRGIEQVSNRVEDQALEALAALRAAQSEPAPVQPVAMRSAEEWAGTYFGINGNNDMELRAAFDTVQQDAIASATDKFEKRRMEFHKFAYSTKAEMDALKDEIVSLRLAASATAERFALENATYYAACPKCPPLEPGHVPQVQRVNLGEMPAKFKCRICKCKYTMGVAEDSATGAGDVWQTIETAPKDGTRILLGLVDSNGGTKTEIGWFDEGGYFEDRLDWKWTDQNYDEGEVLYLPAKWQRIPLLSGSEAIAAARGKIGAG